MKKHILPPLIIFTLTILGACFAHANFNVFEWDAADRVFILLINGFVNFGYQLYREEQNKSKTK